MCDSINMTNNTTETKRFIELELGLSLSKAEGNLNFLAKSTNTEGNKVLSITQGTAILDALHAVQKARKELQEIIYKQRKNNS